MTTLAGCTVAPISRELAQALVVKYEWLGSMPPAPFTVGTYGLIAGDGEIIGAVVLTNGHGTRSGLVCGERWATRTACLARGVCAPWAPPNAASFLISRAVRLLRREHSVVVVFAYADPHAGEVGAVYQAASWSYIGMGLGRRSGATRPVALHRPSGARLSERAVRERRGTDDPLTKGRCMRDLRADPDWLVLPSAPRRTYVTFVGTRAERRAARADLRHPVLPYPKRGDLTSSKVVTAVHVPPGSLARHEADKAALEGTAPALRRRRTERRVFLNTGKAGAREGSGTPPATAKGGPLRAGVYVPALAADKDRRRLAEWVASEGWTLAAVLSDAGGDIGPRAHRHGRDALLLAARRAEFDVILAPTVPSLARSLAELCDVLDAAREGGARVVTLDGALGSQPEAEAALTASTSLLRALDASIIADRVGRGHEAARASGGRIGRPRLAPEKMAAIDGMIRSGAGVRATARAVGVGLGTVSSRRRRINQDDEGEGRRGERDPGDGGAGHRQVGAGVLG